jgi:hypothetical protein
LKNVNSCLKNKIFSYLETSGGQNLNLYLNVVNIFNARVDKMHRDRTRVQMLAKIFPHLKVKCLLFMGPTLGFDTKQRNSFLIKFGFFLQLKQDSDNIIHS